MFKGEYQQLIDDRGRIIVPAKMREALGQEIVMTKGLDQCLFVCSAAGWEDINDKAKKLSLTNQAARAFLRTLYSGAMDVELDSQKRALIPPALRKYAGLERDVVIIGVGTRVEIWDKDKWSEYSEKSAAEYEATAEKLAGLETVF
ncbi:MAG: division/cell wall cluster transcriptional repressor MraZ [Clostridiales bacterium]|nr:division/cell wall cluster transcriptional repressor MraZ [Clostridiales bacterium]